MNIREDMRFVYPKKIKNSSPIKCSMYIYDKVFSHSMKDVALLAVTGRLNYSVSLCDIPFTPMFYSCIT